MILARACPRRLRRRGALEALLSGAGVLLLAGGFLGTHAALPDEVRAASRPSFLLSATLTAGLGVASLAAAGLRFRRALRSRVLIEEGTVDLDGRRHRLGGPAHSDGSTLILSTTEGPRVLQDVYDRPLPELQEAATAAWRPVPETPRADIDLGVGLRISPGWLALGALGLWAWYTPESVGELLSRLPGMWVPYLSWGVLLASAAVVGILWRPSRLSRRGVRLTDRSLTIRDDEVRHLPLEAVRDVYRTDGLWIECLNGSVLRVPCESLERELNEACGLDPERYAYWPDLVRAAGSRRKALVLLLTKPRERGKPILRTRLRARPEKS